jgi:hypothetical protein
MRLSLIFCLKARLSIVAARSSDRAEFVGV